jgi:small subunit ribosomal protein S8e
MRKSLENLNSRKPSGGRRVSRRARRKFEIDRYPTEAVLGSPLTVTRRTRGNNIKTSLKTANKANIWDPRSKKMTRAVITRVSKNPSNKDYERRGVISKGALIETEIGPARVLSRPGQEGSVNAVLVDS